MNTGNDPLPETVTLPDHIIIEQILPRLPVKSLLRYKCVSKSWLSTISSSKFAKSQLKFSSSHPHFLILSRNACDSKNTIFCLQYNERDNNVTDFNELVFENESDPPIELFNFVASSCNGLVCLHVYQRDVFVIWNPATRCYRIINSPVDDGEIKTLPISCQFYYASYIDDYRICAAFSSQTRDNGIIVHFYAFSLTDGEWKRIDHLNEYHYLLNDDCSNVVLVDDTIYIIGRLCQWRDAKRIIGFDLVTEQFKEIPWMDWLSRYDWVNLKELRGCLSLLCCTPDFVYEIWMLKQSSDWNSWQKVCSVDSRIARYHGSSETGKCLIHIEGQLKVAEPSQGTLQLSQRGIDFDPGWNLMLQSQSYLQSLVSPL